MHDWLGMGLIALGVGLAFAGVVKHRNRSRTRLAAGAIRPEFAAMGEMVRPLILFAVAVVALKMSVFYFVFGGDRLMTALQYAGLLFVLATYCVYLVVATARPRVSELGANSDRGMEANSDRGMRANSDRGMEANSDRGMEANSDRGMRANSNRGMRADSEQGLEAKSA